MYGPPVAVTRQGHSRKAAVTVKVHVIIVHSLDDYWFRSCSS